MRAAWIPAAAAGGATTMCVVALCSVGINGALFCLGVLGFSLLGNIADVSHWRDEFATAERALITARQKNSQLTAMLKRPHASGRYEPESHARPPVAEAATDLTESETRAG